MPGSHKGVRVFCVSREESMSDEADKQQQVDYGMKEDGTPYQNILLRDPEQMRDIVFLHIGPTGAMQMDEYDPDKSPEPTHMLPVMVIGSIPSQQLRENADNEDSPRYEVYFLKPTDALDIAIQSVQMFNGSDNVVEALEAAKAEVLREQAAETFKKRMEKESDSE